MDLFGLILVDQKKPLRVQVRLMTLMETCSLTTTKKKIIARSLSG